MKSIFEIAGIVVGIALVVTAASMAPSLIRYVKMSQM
jgi:hypothetical protein